MIRTNFFQLYFPVTIATFPSENFKKNLKKLPISPLLSVKNVRLMSWVQRWFREGSVRVQRGFN